MWLGDKLATFGDIAQLSIGWVLTGAGLIEGLWMVVTEEGVDGGVDQDEARGEVEEGASVT